MQPCDNRNNMLSEERPGRTVEADVMVFDGDTSFRKTDTLATEEPLEIRLRAGRETKTIAVTMRTPGNDFELAAGFLYSEGIIHGRDELNGISYCLDSTVNAEQRYNVVNVDLGAQDLPNIAALERHFTTNSSCGVCGRAQIEGLRDLGIAPIADQLRVSIELIHSFSEKLREAQRLFAATGGLHAAALFDSGGQLVASREDIGRHNAVDKVVGWGLLEAHLPFTASILFVSGRASYEIVQKSIVAGIPIVCAISAPSSLAVALADQFGVTLVGFARERRLNVYTHRYRLQH